MIDTVYRQISDAQQVFLSQAEEFAAALQNDSVLSKLRVIGKHTDPGGPQLTFTLSLMDGSRISYHPEEPAFFIVSFSPHVLDRLIEPH